MALWTGRGFGHRPGFLDSCAIEVFVHSLKAERLCFGADLSSLLPFLLAPRGSCRKRTLFRRTWIYVQEPEAAGDGNCWRRRLAVARGFWQGCKWTQWVTQSFPVSLHLRSLFTVVLSQPSFIYSSRFPASVTSSNRKQMSSSESEVAVICPSHHQGNTSDIDFHIVGSKTSLKDVILKWHSLY